MADSRTVDQVKEILNYVPVDQVDYTDWLNVGMALKNEGYSLDLWESWSAKDPDRYKPEGSESCATKWDSFDKNGKKMGTIIELAKKYGCPDSVWKTGNPDFLTWDSMITADGSRQEFRSESTPPVATAKRVPQAEGIALESFTSCEGMSEAEQKIAFLKALFQPGEWVECESSVKLKDGSDDKYSCRDIGSRRALKQEDIISGIKAGREFQNYNQPAGMWVCINPVDGTTKKAGSIEYPARENANITAFRNLLIESDEGDLERQEAWLINSGLPIKAIYTSGNKSVHACIAVNANDMKEYSDRVESVYSWIRSQSDTFKLDEANKNPSRLTRFPGFFRGDTLQKLLYLNECPKSFEDWEKQAYRPDKKATEEDEYLPTGDQFKPEKVKWLIYRAIPAKTITLIGAEGGSGKSTFISGLISSLISGKPTYFDDLMDNFESREPKRVMLFSSEDDYNSQTLPRLIAQGCTKEDLKRLWVIPNSDKRFPQIKYNSKLLFKYVDEKKPDLLIFDPLQAFLPNETDMAKRNQMRNIFQELLVHTASINCAVLISCHVNKSLQFSGLNRIADSKDITDIARSVFLMGVSGEKDDEGNSIKYLSHEKSSYHRPLDSILFKVNSVITATEEETGIIEVLGSTDLKDFDYTASKRESNNKDDGFKTDIIKKLILEDPSYVSEWRNNSKYCKPEELNTLVSLLRDEMDIEYGKSVSESTVKRTIKDLEKKGMMSRRTTGKGSDKKTRVFRFSINYQNATVKEKEDLMDEAEKALSPSDLKRMGLADPEKVSGNEPEESSQEQQKEGANGKQNTGEGEEKNETENQL